MDTLDPRKRRPPTPGAEEEGISLDMDRRYEAALGQVLRGPGNSEGIQTGEQWLTEHVGTWLSSLSISFTESTRRSSITT